jgi:hypothetical protein
MFWHLHSPKGRLLLRKGSFVRLAHSRDRKLCTGDDTQGGGRINRCELGFYASESPVIRICRHQVPATKHAWMGDKWQHPRRETKRVQWRSFVWQSEGTSG